MILVILVTTGGREYVDVDRIEFVLQTTVNHYVSHGLTPIIRHGMARGCDSIVEHWCRMNQIQSEPFPYPKGMGKSGGPYRNRQMLITGRPELLISFPGGSGTENCTKQAYELGIPVLRVKP